MVPFDWVSPTKVIQKYFNSYQCVDIVCNSENYDSINILFKNFTAMNLYAERLGRIMSFAMENPKS